LNSDGLTRSSMVICSTLPLVLSCIKWNKSVPAGGAAFILGGAGGKLRQPWSPASLTGTLTAGHDYQWYESTYSGAFFGLEWEAQRPAESASLNVYRSCSRAVEAPWSGRCSRSRSAGFVWWQRSESGRHSTSFVRPGCALTFDLPLISFSAQVDAHRVVDRQILSDRTLPIALDKDQSTRRPYRSIFLADFFLAPR